MFLASLYRAPQIDLEVILVIIRAPTALGVGFLSSRRTLDFDWVRCNVWVSGLMTLQVGGFQVEKVICWLER